MTAPAPRARRALRFLLLGAGTGVGALVGLAVLATGWHVATHGRTPPISDASGRPVPGSIASLERISLGGVPQWVLIRGRSTRNPVVLFLHGGPGMPAMYLAHAWQRPLEDDFVVVHWDRLGAGKSFFGGIPARYLTVRRLLDNTYELVNILRGRFQQDRIILVGHSWGSYLGMLAVRERPDLFRAFVGAGQVTGAGRGDTLAARLQEAFIRREAERRGVPEAARELDEQGRAVVEKWLFRFGGELQGATSWWPLMRIGLRAPEYTLGDVVRMQRGLALYAGAMGYDVPADTIRVNVTAVQVPAFFVAGRHDYTTPSDLVERYFAGLRAPQKAFVWFERSAHFPFLEEPARFAEVMRQVAAATAGDRVP
ncbi:MAG: alpha/beta hydrolase [Gemmatimonadota bacterium]